jgi:hypothetical protein
MGERYFPLQDTTLAGPASACTRITDYCRCIDSIKSSIFDDFQNALQVVLLRVAQQQGEYLLYDVSLSFYL